MGPLSHIFRRISESLFVAQQMKMTKKILKYHTKSWKRFTITWWQYNSPVSGKVILFLQDYSSDHVLYYFLFWADQTRHHVLSQFDMVLNQYIQLWSNTVKTSIKNLVWKLSGCSVRYVKELSVNEKII